MTVLPDERKAPPRRTRLWAEFLGFFVGFPVAIAVGVPPERMFAMLFGFTVLGLALLHVTPGFQWRSLTVGLRRIDWRIVGGFTALTAMAGYVIVQLTAPGAGFVLLRQNPALMLTIALLYPILSALPQELVFRPLFFRRYSAILPQGRYLPILLNAAVFAYAHLMYWSWIVAAMTFTGGLAFAWSYERRGNFPEAVLLHALAGVVVFALGLGAFFYSGNVRRPF